MSLIISGLDSNLKSDIFPFCFVVVFFTILSNLVPLLPTKHFQLKIWGGCLVLDTFYIGVI